MGVSKAFVQKTLRKHLSNFGDAWIPCLFVHYTNQSPDYDASTSVITDTTTQFAIEAIFSDFSFTKNQSGWKELDGSAILAKDKKAIVQFTDFPTGVKPEIDDLLTNNETSIIYNVVGANVDPYDGIYILHLRPQEE